MTLDLFYLEPDPDRWLPFDRYPRRLVRRLLRGPPRPGGQTRVFLNLMAGLEGLGVEFRVNDFRYSRRHPERLACIIGKPFVLDLVEWCNPILFGAAVMNHPVDDPTLFQRRPVRHVLVPGPWMEEMCKPFWGDKVQAWPVGIDTERWIPDGRRPSFDVLLYNKVRWNHDAMDASLVAPVRAALTAAGIRWREIRYGSYEEEDYLEALRACRCMVFVCEHETQGLAYQQALSCGVPVLAWDRQGAWRDLAYYPRVVFSPVTSVPYWDRRCGEKFSHAGDFPSGLARLMDGLDKGAYDPRGFILENLTLEQCAEEYVRIARHVQNFPDAS